MFTSAAISVSLITLLIPLLSIPDQQVRTSPSCHAHGSDSQSRPFILKLIEIHDIKKTECISQNLFWYLDKEKLRGMCPESAKKLSRGISVRNGHFPKSSRRCPHCCMLSETQLWDLPFNQLQSSLEIFSKQDGFESQFLLKSDLSRCSFFGRF